MIYADTSAIAKLIILEDETQALENWLRGNGQRLITSVLTQIELERAVMRRKPELFEKVDAVLRKFDLFSLTPGIVRQAGTLHPASLRTLDAIHLATMLTFRNDSIALLSYDDRLNLAAKVAGYEPITPK